MLRVLDERDLELMPRYMRGPLDSCGVEPRYGGAGECGESKGSARHSDTV